VQRKQKHGIDAAHLSINWNWLRPGGGYSHERQPTAPRPGKSHSFNSRIGDKGSAYFVSRINKKREDTQRQARGRDGGLHRSSNQFRRPQMRWMRLCNDRTTSSERGSRVASGHREREWKIARAEHCGGTNANMPLT
jgi:hypothetical protein